MLHRARPDGISEWAGIEAGEMAESGDCGGIRGSRPGLGAEATPEKGFEGTRPASEPDCGALYDGCVGGLDPHRAEIIANRRGSPAKRESANIGRRNRSVGSIGAG